jgi:nucleoside-diphosphate-sugar epimerase
MESQRHLVIGSGLLGRAIIDALLARDIAVRVLDITTYDNPNTHNITGDIRNRDVVRHACEDVTTVYHTVSLVSQSLGRPAHLYDVNVTGTENVIDACRIQRVKHLVYTSSIDVVFDGTPISSGDEHLAYPKQHLDYYGETKMIAEQHALRANDDSLKTVALRVAGLYGAHDQHRFPPIIKLARQGSFVRLGDGKAKFNHLYVENAAHAHLLVAEALQHAESPVPGGQYFITDQPATNFFDFMEQFVRKLELPVTIRRVPERIADLVARGYAMRYQVLTREAFATPLLTRYAVAATCKDFWFSHQLAARDFGYRPIIPADEAESRTLAWLRRDLLNAVNISDVPAR